MNTLYIIPIGSPTTADNMLDVGGILHIAKIKGNCNKDGIP